MGVLFGSLDEAKELILLNEMFFQKEQYKWIFFD